MTAKFNLARGLYKGSRNGSPQIFYILLATPYILFKFKAPALVVSGLHLQEVGS